MSQIWSSIHAYGVQHGVDPLLFALIYVVRLPFLLLSLAVLAQRARRRRGVAPAAVVFLSLGILPYLYVVAFGRGLPLWLETAAIALALLAVLQGARKVRSTLRDKHVGDEPVPAAQDA